MKYKHILNGQVLFETNDYDAYYHYLLTDDRAKQAANSILYNLLYKSKGYICNMGTKNK